jgi:competence protein ComEC
MASTRIPAHSGVRLGIYSTRSASSAFSLSDATAPMTISVVRHWEGDEFDLGGARIDVLFPPRDWPIGLAPKNNDSIGPASQLWRHFRIAGGRRRESGGAADRDPASPEGAAIKGGPSRSATSTTSEILEAVKPSFAVISVGFRNSYGLPKTDVLQRLQASGVASTEPISRARSLSTSTATM